MGFIIKSAFWLSLVLLLIPVGGDDTTETVGPIQAFFAAREAVGDIAGMCERKPDVCVTGRLALSTITVRARESARYAMEMLEDEPAADAPADVASSDHVTTGTVAPQAD
ncbi:MAG: DUF5330 domain-containing protein [Brucellaceae bacterium]|nr:DUF5330 domain-containing protein [Brucellaceae bacterium]